MTVDRHARRREDAVRCHQPPVLRRHRRAPRVLRAAAVFGFVAVMFSSATHPAAAADVEGRSCAADGGGGGGGGGGGDVGGGDGCGGDGGGGGGSSNEETSSKIIYSKGDGVGLGGDGDGGGGGGGGGDGGGGSVGDNAKELDAGRSGGRGGSRRSNTADDAVLNGGWALPPEEHRNLDSGTLCNIPRMPASEWDSKVRVCLFIDSAPHCRGWQHLQGSILFPDMDTVYTLYHCTFVLTCTEL